MHEAPAAWPPDPAPANLSELEPAARARLSPAAYDYYAGGAEDEVTLRANRAAFQRWFLRPRVLVDVSAVDLGVELLGERLALPVLLAPTAFQRLAWPQGEIASARAARAAGTLFVASTIATTSVEESAAAAPGPFWFQLYVFRQREITRALVERAEAAGCTALVLTVTVPVQGNRERDARNRFHLPPGLEMANFTGLRQAQFPQGQGSGLEAFIGREFDASLDWEALAWLRSITRLPILLKGVLAAEDARLALEHGASGVIVSNHGGRQLDGALPTLQALPRVAEAVQGRIPVLMDGGVRRGSDVVKALALGARGVLIGRPDLGGLALGGQAGVEWVLATLGAEVARTLALLGCPSAARVPREALEAAGDWAAGAGAADAG
jgi:4-hydroxymandelate oxidase